MDDREKSVMVFFCYFIGSLSIGFGLAEIYSIGVGLISFGCFVLLASGIMMVRA